MKKFLIVVLIFVLGISVVQGADMEKRKTIMIDLDGVLNMYNGKYDENKLPEIRKGAKEFVQKLNEDYDLVLFTTRNNLEASRWLIKNKMDEYFKDVTSIKTPAYIYLDDRAIGFNGDYEKVLAQIEGFKVHWKGE